MFPKDYYKLVEKLDYLQHILYGDSVAENTKLVLNWNNYNRCLDIQTFGTLWNELAKKYWIKTINNKEYIPISNNDINIQTYDVNTNKIIYKCPNYIMRHYISKDIYRLFTDDNNFIDLTPDHSIIQYDEKNNKLYSVKPKDIQVIYQVHDNIIKPHKIIDKKLIRYTGYVYDVEVEDTHNFVANNYLVHNTDSIFVLIPDKTSKDLSLEDRWEIASKVAEDINDLIISYNQEYLLPRLNIDPKHNRTFFKTEYLMESMMFLDVKKNYAYMMSVKEGKVLDPEEPDCKGLPIIKSDAANMTKQILRELVYELILDKSIDSGDKYKLGIDIINKYREKYINFIKEYNFADIGLPKKWSKQALPVSGMKLYNRIMEDTIFSSGSSGRVLYIKKPPDNVIADLGFKDNYAITVPYDYDTDKLIDKFNKNHIKIDNNNHWEKVIYHKIIYRIVKLLELYKK